MNAYVIMAWIFAFTAIAIACTATTQIAALKKEVRMLKEELHRTSDDRPGS